MKTTESFDVSGKAALVTGAAKGRYSKPATAVFDWSAAAK